MAPKVIILILNWNGWEDTLVCLESVFLTSYSNYQVVVLDNASTNDSVERIREWADGKRKTTERITSSRGITKPVSIIVYDKDSAERGGSREEEELLRRVNARSLVMIQTGENLGFAGGNNVGIRYALTREADYVFLLNNDAFLRSSETLANLVDFMEKTTRAGACGGRLFYPDGAPQQSYGNFPTLLRIMAVLFPLYRLFPEKWLRLFKRSNVVPDDSVIGPIRVDWPSGACLFVRAKMIEEVGMLDEQFFLYVEETDWCYRMQAKGWDRYYVPEVHVIHAYAGSVGKSTFAMRSYHLTSQFLYYRKHFSPAKLAMAIAGYLLRASWSIPFWTAAALVLPEHRGAAAHDHARFWLQAYHLSLGAFKDLILGKVDTNVRSRDTGPGNLI
jgi:GT2 family glycosyltransferase